jgi:DNA-binding NarL/FixJ family response regulator
MKTGGVAMKARNYRTGMEVGLAAAPRPSSTTSVIVQDRSNLYREGLQLLLESSTGIRVIALAGDGGMLEAACRIQPPDAVLFEAARVPWDVASLVDQIRQSAPGATLIGTFSHELRRHRSIEGVVYVRRTSPSSVFLRSIKSRGRDTHSPSRQDEAGFGSTDNLTQRELQVLALICGGHTTRQVSERLGISAKTVENRKQALFAKLGVQNQSHAVAIAMRTGLLGSGTSRDADA